LDDPARPDALGAKYTPTKWRILATLCGRDYVESAEMTPAKRQCPILFEPFILNIKIIENSLKAAKGVSSPPRTASAWKIHLASLAPVIP
jgi:hypothetical protein